MGLRNLFLHPFWEAWVIDMVADRSYFFPYLVLVSTTFDRDLCHGSNFEVSKCEHCKSDGRETSESCKRERKPNCNIGGVCEVNQVKYLETKILHSYCIWIYNKLYSGTISEDSNTLLEFWTAPFRSVPPIDGIRLDLCTYLFPSWKFFNKKFIKRCKILTSYCYCSFFHFRKIQLCGYC